MPIRHLQIACSVAAAALMPAGAATAQTYGAQGAAIAVAAEPQQVVISQLSDQGYSIIEVRLTLLGRIRILAERRGELREIVVSRSTGEILRDVSREQAVTNQNGSSQPSGGGRLGGGLGGSTGGGLGESVSEAAESIGDDLGL